MTNVFAWAALVLVVALGYRHHSRAVVLLAALLPTYLLRLHVVGIPTTFLEMGIWLVAAVGLLQPPVRQQWKNVWRQLPAVARALLGLWLVACVLSVVVSDETRVSLGILKGWVVTPMLLGWLVLVVSDTPVLRRRVISALLLSGTAVSLWGLLPVTRYPLRVTSVYDVPNSLALFSAPLVVMAVWLAIRVARWRYGAAAVIMALALLATQSVTGVAAAVAALLAGVFVWRPVSWRRFLVLLLAAAGVVLLYWSETGRITYLAAPWQEGKPNSISVRGQLWSVGSELIREHPLVGIGLGQFEPAYQVKLHKQFQQFENCLPAIALAPAGKLKIENCTRPLAEYVFRDPHNWILSFWLNTGLLGLVSFVGLHMYGVWRVATQNNRWREAVPQAVLLALLAIFLHGLVDTIYWKNDLAALQWVLLVMVLGWGWGREVSAL